MKNSSRFWATLTCVLGLQVLCGPCWAQGVQLGVSGGYAAPISDFSRLVSEGYGGEATARIYFKDNFLYGLTAGHYTYELRNLSSLKCSGSFRMIPLTFTLVYQPFGHKAPVRPYVGLDAGAYMFLIDEDVTPNPARPDVVVNRKKEDVYFGFNPGLGMMINLSEWFILDGGIKYGYIFGEDDNQNSASQATTYFMFHGGIIVRLFKFDYIDRRYYYRKSRL